MEGRETKGAPSANLLVCFPTRAHLTLMPPKPICSPARLLEPNKCHHKKRHARNKSMSRLGSNGGDQASPLLWAKNKQIGIHISEPSSPKVTCAGQIKVRHKANCKSWQSVMEEIERIHNDRKNKKRSTWKESMVFKRDILHFLTCLRNIRLDFRCFGVFPQSDITSDDEDEVQDEEEDVKDHKEANGGGGDGSEGSRTVFSKWFMVLQESQSKGCVKEERKDVKEKGFEGNKEEKLGAPCVPPPNALLLMRCRSAPAKSWFEEKQEEEEEELKGEYQEDVDKDEEKVDRKQVVVKRGKNLKTLMDEEESNEKERLVVMRYDSGLHKISSDLAKETWVVDGTIDPLSRS